jgi:hypothetical protein
MRKTYPGADMANYIGVATLFLLVSAANAAWAQEFPGTYVQVPGPLGFRGAPIAPTNLTPNSATDYVFLARQTNGTMSGVNYLPLSSFEPQSGQVQQLYSGVAAAVAISSAPMPSAPGRTTWSVNAAAFQSEVGGGFSLAYRLPTNIPIAVTASYGSGGAYANVGRIGLMGEF